VLLAIAGRLSTELPAIVAEANYIGANAALLGAAAALMGISDRHGLLSKFPSF
jgi:hypothetical protein